MSIEPWNTGADGGAVCEDMPRKSIDIKLTEHPVQQKRGLLRPFPAFRRGRVRAEPDRTLPNTIVQNQGFKLCICVKKTGTTQIQNVLDNGYNLILIMPQNIDL